MNRIQSIDVYESRDYIGGRLKSVEIGGQQENIGGDVWSSVNYYMCELQQELGIPLDNDSYIGNGNNI
jgi:protoporphyrinogen oxidase